MSSDPDDVAVIQSDPSGTITVSRATTQPIALDELQKLLDQDAKLAVLPELEQKQREHADRIRFLSDGDQP